MQQVDSSWQSEHRVSTEFAAAGQQHLSSSGGSVTSPVHSDFNPSSPVLPAGAQRQLSSVHHAGQTASREVDQNGPVTAKQHVSHNSVSESLNAEPSSHYRHSSFSKSASQSVTHDQDGESVQEFLRASDSESEIDNGQPVEEHHSTFDATYNNKIDQPDSYYHSSYGQSGSASGLKAHDGEYVETFSNNSVFASENGHPSGYQHTISSTGNTSDDDHPGARYQTSHSENEFSSAIQQRGQAAGHDVSGSSPELDVHNHQSVHQFHESSSESRSVSVLDSGHDQPRLYESHAVSAVDTANDMPPRTYARSSSRSFGGSNVPRSGQYHDTTSNNGHWHFEHSSGQSLADGYNQPATYQHTSSSVNDKQGHRHVHQFASRSSFMSGSQNGQPAQYFQTSDSAVYDDDDGLPTSSYQRKTSTGFGSPGQPVPPQYQTKHEASFGSQMDRYPHGDNYHSDSMLPGQDFHGNRHYPNRLDAGREYLNFPRQGSHARGVGDVFGRPSYPNQRLGNSMDVSAGLDYFDDFGNALALQGPLFDDGFSAFAQVTYASLAACSLTPAPS